jgi:hypothetical protein
MIGNSFRRTGNLRELPDRRRYDPHPHNLAPLAGCDNALSLRQHCGKKPGLDEDRFFEHDLLNSPRDEHNKSDCKRVDSVARRKPDSAHPDWPVLYLTVHKDNAGVASGPVAKPKNYGSQPAWRQSKTANMPSISLDPCAARACGGVHLRRGRIPALIAIFQPPAAAVALQHYAQVVCPDGHPEFS